MEPKLTKTLRVTLEIRVEDISSEALAVAAEEMEMQVEELETLEHMGPDDAERVASVLTTVGMEGCQDLLFEGSDMYVHFTDATVTKAEWVE